MSKRRTQAASMVAQSVKWNSTRRDVQERTLMEVAHHDGGRHAKQLILCTSCLVKRVAKVPRWNTSAREYDTYRFKGWGHGRGIQEYYRINWEHLVLSYEKLECHDCGWKLRGRVTL